jgi:hypothetical protein
MPEEIAATLRERIIQYMRKNEKSVRGWFPTWWFKFHVSGARDTPEIRRELERMRRDGLVEADHSQSNNTKWKLTEKPSEVTP